MPIVFYFNSHAGIFAVIDCITNFVSDMNVTSLGQCLSNKWVKVNRGEEDDKIQLGVVLTVQGKVRVFRGNRQITCQQISKLEIQVILLHLFTCYLPTTSFILSGHFPRAARVVSVDKIRPNCMLNLIAGIDMLVQIYLSGVERDPTYEACHMVQTMDLCKNFYSKPIVEIVKTSPRMQVCTLTPLKANCRSTDTSVSDCRGFKARLDRGSVLIDIVH